MKTELKIPSMGESITEVTIGKLLKPTGSNVAIDEEVLEIETDKLNQVLYAPQAGSITFTVKPGDVVQVGTTVAYIEEGSQEKVVPKEAPAKEVLQKPVEPKVVQLQQQNIEREPIRKTKDEWVEELDVETKSSEKEIGQIPSKRTETRKKLSPLKRIMGERLVQVGRETAMLTTFNEVDMSLIMSLREKYKEPFQKKFGTKLGFMSFFIKASTYALQAFPIVNSSIDTDELVFHNYIDISVAVSTEKGLIVPVLRDVDQLSYADIEKKIDEFATSAKTGTLSLNDLKGGGFTITNGGTFGSLLSTPILNPPQCAILGMHKITKRPVVVDDQIVIRPMMYLALSYDHRVLDGKDAVTFLVHIKNSLEDPQRMMLDI